MDYILLDLGGFFYNSQGNRRYEALFFNKFYWLELPPWMTMVELFASIKFFVTMYKFRNDSLLKLLYESSGIIFLKRVNRNDFSLDGNCDQLLISGSGTGILYIVQSRLQK